MELAVGVEPDGDVVVVDAEQLVERHVVSVVVDAEAVVGHRGHGGELSLFAYCAQKLVIVGPIGHL